MHQQRGRGPGFGRHRIDRFQQAETVDGMDGAEPRCGFPDLVGLQGSDQMPSDLKVGRSVDLL
jgi:hypothetical protein